MNTLKLFQIYYEPTQHWALNEGATPEFNPYRTRIFENDVIRRIYDEERYKGAKYVGFTSWRLTEKTGLSYAKLKEYIKENPGYDCYIYGRFRDEFIRIDRGYIREAMEAIYESILEEKNPDLKWVNVFCNYWICTPKVFERYMKWWYKIHKELPYCMKYQHIVGSSFELYRAQNYPRDVFIYEYFFGLFLYHNPDITICEIPNMLNEKRHPLLEKKGNERAQVDATQKKIIKQSLAN